MLHIPNIMLSKTNNKLRLGNIIKNEIMGERYGIQEL